MIKNDMKHNIKNTSPFATKQLGDKLNKIIERSGKGLPKFELTRDDKDMIHVVALLVFIFSLLGTAIVILALTF